MNDRSGWGKVWSGVKVAGRASATAARWVGRQAADGYHAIDPDVRRHVAELPLMALTMADKRRAPVEHLPEDGCRPVIFVHGLGGHRGNFVPMATYFRAHGRQRMYRVEIPDEVGDIAARAQVLADYISEIARVLQLEASDSIDLVGHSMGGLVSRMVLECDLPVRVANLITLGTPHHGTHIARYAATDITLELRPTSETIAALDEQLPWPGPPSHPRLVALWSGADVILLPHTSATVEGATNLEMEGVTHYGYLIRPSCWRTVLDVLDDQI